MTIHLWYSDGSDGPRTSPAEAAAAAGFGPDTPRRVTLGWTTELHPWLTDPSLDARTVVGGFSLGRAVTEGRIAAVPVRLGAVPSMIEEDQPDVAVITAVPRGRDYAFGSSVGWGATLARRAHRVVLEIDDEGADLGGPLIEGHVVATVPRPAAPSGPPAAPRPADDIDLRIGELVASLLPEHPTLQFGPGGIGEGIARSLDRPVRIWSGLVTDAMAELHPRGLLTEPVVATYVWGGRPVVDLANAGMLRLTTCDVTHDLSAMSSMPALVGCNTALQVGLDGAVNVERVGGRTISAVGGHSDFCVAASRSVGGLSIIAVRSLTAVGGSTIVPAVEQVSTQRSDIDIVVTEHGVADLRGAGDTDRARRLVAVAAPGHRDMLQRALEEER